MDRGEQFLYQLGWYEEEHFKRRGYEENEPGWGMPSDDKDFYGTYYKNKKTPKDAKIEGTATYVRSKYVIVVRI